MPVQDQPSHEQVMNPNKITSIVLALLLITVSVFYVIRPNTEKGTTNNPVILSASFKKVSPKKGETVGMVEATLNPIDGISGCIWHGSSDITDYVTTTDASGASVEPFIHKQQLVCPGKPEAGASSTGIISFAADCRNNLGEKFELKEITVRYNDNLCK